MHNIKIDVPGNKAENAYLCDTLGIYMLLLRLRNGKKVMHYPKNFLIIFIYRRISSDFYWKKHSKLKD